MDIEWLQNEYQTDKEREHVLFKYFDCQSKIVFIIWQAPQAGKITKSHAVIGYPSGQDAAILPAWDYPLYPTSKISPKAI